MKRAIPFLAFFLLAGSLLAQNSPPASQTAPKDTTCAISGRVVRLVGGEPLKKARVVLNPADDQGRAQKRREPHVAITDDTGKFAIPGIEPGRYRLTVLRSGYVTQEYGQKTPNRPGAVLALDPGLKLEDVLFRMVSAGVITGRVLDEDGEGVPWVVIQALRSTYIEGKKQLLAEGDVTTNDLGEYRLFGLTPGRYYLSATAGGRLAAMERGSIVRNVNDTPGYAPTYYPGTNDAARAAAVEVHGGEEATGVDFSMFPTRTYTVRGRVFNSITGKPGQGATVFLSRQENGTASFSFSRDSSTRVDDPQGNFTLKDVTPGTYLLTAMSINEGNRQTASQTVNVAGGDVEGLNLVIAPGVDLAGRLVLQGQVNAPLSELRVVLQPKVPELFGAHAAAVKPDGTFVLGGVGEGVYQVAVFGGSPDSFLRSANSGGDDVLEKGLDVSRGMPSSLEIVVSNAGASIDGLVLNSDALPVAAARVVLVPDAAHRGQRRLYKDATTDEFGRYALRGIAPGSYELFAWEEVEENAWEDPDFLGPWEGQGTPVRVEDGSGKMIELKLIPAGQSAAGK
jgi:protocatechuate 3,4-dioxygenase beta subunit